MNALHFLLIVTFAGGTLAAAQPASLGTVGRPDRNRPGPWDNDVLAYRVAADGAAEQLATFERAGVPTLARLRDGRIIAAFQHFPEDDDRNFDRVAVCFSGDEGRTWTRPKPIVVENLEQGLARPFDPTLVPLPDGRIRLYFTSNRSPDFRRSTPAIYSAISTDGIHHVFEPGARFAIEGRIVIDCAAVLHDGVFHLIVPDNGSAEDFMAWPQRRQEPASGSGYHAISKDGLKFGRVADVKLSSARDRWLGNMQNDGGKLFFFGTGPGPWPVTSKDGVAWETAATSTRVPGADPGAVKLRDGSWLLAVTSAPRPGTPGALQRGTQPGQPAGERPGLRSAPRSQNFDEQAPPLPGAPRNQPRSGNPPAQSGGLGSHNIHSATSTDGLNWTRDEGVRVASASVPCAINDGDRRVLLYFVKPPDQPGRPETVACAVSTDGLKFDPAPEFRIEGLSTLKAVDPSIIKAGDGKFRLYYLASDKRGDPARAPNPHAIHLAISDDGLRFREAGPVFTYDDLVDPDVFHFKDKWFMYVFAGRATVIATSADGRQFSHLRDMMPRDWGTTAPLLLSNGRLRLYAFEQRVPGGNAVRSFLSTNGVDWVAEPGDRLKATADEQITDPFVIPWRGGYKMFFKTSPARTPQFPEGEDAPSLRDREGIGPATLRQPADIAGRSPQFANESTPLAPRFDSLFIRIPSCVTGKEGIAASVLIPMQPRFTNGAPVVINVAGGVQAGSAHGRPEYVRHGFVEIHFAFPGGGEGDERSGGRYDFRGTNCLRALADVIRFATGRIADQAGRHIGDVARGVTVLTKNVGMVGSSHGGNACGMAMALYGAEFPDLAWYASMESPYGEGAANVELGGRDSGLNPAYDPKTGVLDLSRLAWSPDLSPGLMRKPMLVNARQLHGAFFFDLDGDGHFSEAKDFPVNGFVGDAGGGVKAWYSPRILAETEKRKLITGERPGHVPTLAQSQEFWRCRDAAPSIAEAVRNCTNLAVIVYANERDHVQADPAHTHILEQVAAFQKAGARFVRLNPDRAYVERVAPRGPAFQREMQFRDNPAGQPWTRMNIAEGVEPSALPLGLYMQAAVCELADRTQAGAWSPNLDTVLFPQHVEAAAIPAGRQTGKMIGQPD